jgi:serine protease Do
MNQVTWSERIKKHSVARWARRLIVPVLALALAGSLGLYELAKPTTADAAIPAAAAPPLNPDSVGALLALDHAVENLAAHVTPAVVNVTVTSKTKPDMSQQMPQGMQQFFGPFGQFFGPGMQARPRIEHGIGSGVIISPDGYIVTNNHVVEGAVDIRVTTHDRRVLNAKLIGRDPLTDLAVLKVDGTDLPSIPWGDSTTLKPGQSVLAFGNPYGFSFTVTRGIVSALNRPNPDPSDRRKPGEFIQTDAAINPGNSGGPLVDARGEVVGIDTFLVSPSGSFSGMGFAIPSQIAKPTVAALIKYGKVSHGYIGIGITDVTPENAKFFDRTSSTGAVVTQVEPDSPGAKAGLKIGDVITAIDGHNVANAGELQVTVGQKQPGATINLTVARNGKELTLPVTLEDMETHSTAGSSSGSEAHGKMRWGLGLTDLSPDLRQQLQVPDRIQGAAVESVQPGSTADNAGLSRGDVILEVNRHAVQNAAEAQQALASIPADQDALLLVWSNGGNTFRVLHATSNSQ